MRDRAHRPEGILSLIRGLVESAAMPALLLTLLLTAVGVRAEDSFTLEWKENRLSVAVDGAPLAQVLALVARRTGIQVRGLEGLKRRAYADFSNLPLSEGLKTILINSSFAIIETASPSTRHGRASIVLVVLDGSADATLNLASAIRQPAIVSEEAAAAMVSSLTSDEDPDRAASLAAAAMRGSDSRRKFAGLQALTELDSPVAAQALGAALKDGDVGVRETAVMGLARQSTEEAIGFLTQAIQDRDPGVRMLALELLVSRGPQAYSGLNSALANRDPAIRSRARELLDQMAAAQ